MRHLPQILSPTLHRGWMLSDTVYAGMHAELMRRGAPLLVSPESYAEAHYLPLAYPHLIGETAESVWMAGCDPDAAWELYQTVAQEDALLKDFVKSAKYRWREACFLPRQTARDRFDAILQTFLEVRGPLFEKGLVFRRFYPLVQVAEDMRGMPVHEEYRLFFWRGELFASSPFPDPSILERYLPLWTMIARRFQTPFLSLDVARLEDGGFLVVEVGDGGVAGLPISIDPSAFYADLRREMAANRP